MPAIKHHFVGASGAQYLCERYDPTIHITMPAGRGIVVFTTGPDMAPHFFGALAADDLARLFEYDALQALKAQHPKATLWFCLRADESRQTTEQVVADLYAARRS